MTLNSYFGSCYYHSIEVFYHLQIGSTPWVEYSAKQEPGTLATAQAIYKCSLYRNATQRPCASRHERGCSRHIRPAFKGNKMKPELRPI